MIRLLVGVLVVSFGVSGCSKNVLPTTGNSEHSTGPLPTNRPEEPPTQERSIEIADGVKMVFCWVPEGESQLGSTKSERTAVLKDLGEKMEPGWMAAEAEENRGKFRTTGFWLGKYPVTQEEWQAVMGDNPSWYNGKKDNKANGMDTSRFPVEYVTWIDCQKFLEKMNSRCDVVKVFGKSGNFMLPHEDQWEYACRGGRGNGRTYYWGDSLNGTQANCDGNNPFGTSTKGANLGRTCAVDFRNGLQYEAHPWGLQHMSGNVYQWCSNKYDQTSGKTDRVIRGGAVRHNAMLCRSAYRNGYVPDAYGEFIGFRVLLSHE